MRMASSLPVMHRGSFVSLPSGSIANITLTGKICMNICVNLYDSVSSIYETVNNSSLEPTWRIVFNGQVLSPALSLAFYGIKNDDTLIVINSNQLIEQGDNCQQRLGLRSGSTRCRCSCNMTDTIRESQRVQRYFNEKCAGVVKDADEVLQRFQDAMNPMTMLESARLTDLCRDRIEANTKSFRKLCAKYYALSEIDKSRTNESKQIKSSTTVLPEKPSLPSTDFLPEISSISRIS